MIVLTEQEFKQIVSYIRLCYGIDLSKKQFLIESRLSVELPKRQIDTFNEFWKRLSQDKSGEWKQLLVDCLTTNYSYFYREEVHLQHLKQTIIQNTMQNKHINYNVWCAGCAAGQEVYTVAMQLMECKQMGLLTDNFTVYGADISEKTLEIARKGIYPLSDYVRIPKQWQNNYCMLLSNSKFEIKRCIKEQVHFFKENLFKPSYIKTKYQVIFCRNVMIYFDEESRKNLIKNLLEVLQDGGYLYIGCSETIQWDEPQLKYIQPAIYQKVGKNKL